ALSPHSRLAGAMVEETGNLFNKKTCRVVTAGYGTCRRECCCYDEFFIRF
ncbi:hypothetical protein HH659_005130, partial [Escherichia coli]|nr:hypothetical protein [Escherichia coli]